MCFKSLKKFSTESYFGISLKYIFPGESWNKARTDYQDNDIAGHSDIIPDCFVNTHTAYHHQHQVHNQIGPFDPPPEDGVMAQGGHDEGQNGTKDGADYIHQGTEVWQAWSLAVHFIHFKLFHILWCNMTSTKSLEGIPTTPVSAPKRSAFCLPNYPKVKREKISM